MPPQGGDSIPCSKISVSSLLSYIFKLLSLVFFLSLSSFDLSFNSHFCLSKKLLIVIFICKISLKCKNKSSLCYFSTFLFNILKLLFLWQTTHVIAYSAIYRKKISAIFCRKMSQKKLTYLWRLLTTRWRKEGYEIRYFSQFSKPMCLRSFFFSGGCLFAQSWLWIFLTARLSTIDETWFFYNHFFFLLKSRKRSGMCIFPKIALIFKKSSIKTD